MPVFTSLPIDLAPVWLSLKLASITTLILLGLCIPLAWWLTRRHTVFRRQLQAISLLPIVLPPSVLGFYLLLLLGAHGPLAALGLPTLAFTFTGLVLASLIYSLPFALQPLLQAFSAMDTRLLETAATLGASPLDRFFSIVLPLSRPAVMTSALLCFIHTLGEFGVILMIGGNIPGETRVLSIAIYDAAETLDYAQAHLLSAGLVLFTLLALLAIYRYRDPLPVTLKPDPPVR